MVSAAEVVVAVHLVLPDRHPPVPGRPAALVRAARLANPLLELLSDLPVGADVRGRCAEVAEEEREVGETASTETRNMVLPFQNEYIYAALQDGKEEEIVCTVPDLISLIGMAGYALGTQDIKYGLRVNVMGLVGHPHWYTERALELGGASDFAYKDMKNASVTPLYYDPPRVTDMFWSRV
ncbi:hydantoinase [Fusarium albosuccineum]|uniref:Hydantoinase n=1 Tax=Fusarium albosuccineum TaxID=1237068 RepID=A0A8H4LQS0_9HYPO|nr:hydantoinase [Fusarium albosuccineum]